MDEERDGIESRIESALRSPEPANELYALATKLRDEGMPQQEMLDWFSKFHLRHRNDVDETAYDAIMDTMDCIVGWCSPGAKLFPS